MTFNKNDINTIDEAKGYSNYYGGKLKGIRGGKTAKIFESSKLNDRDGKLDKTKLQDLAELQKERRNNSDLYQLVNSLGRGNKVDLVVEILEDHLFREVGDISPNKEIEFKALLGVLGNVNQQAQTKDKEIKELAEKCSPEKEQKAIDYLGKVKNAISALKEDLRDNTKISYKILDTIISYTKETCDNIFTTTAANSLIRTGYDDTGIPLTQSLFLTRDLPQQFIALFKKFDKGKRLKERFEQEKFDEEEARKKERDYIFVSDVCKFMHALFPQDDNYKNSPFIQEGRDNSVIGEVYAVYNDTDCVKFNSHDEVISKDGNTKRLIRSEPISDYEAKILTYQKRHRLVDAMACSYLERAIEIIEANGINYKEPKGFASHKEMVDASKKTGWDTNATQYIEYDKKTITTDVINKYDEMKPIAQAQIDAFTSLKENKAQQKLDDFENQIKTLCNNNLVEVRKQFKVVYEQSPVELIWRTEKKQTQVNFLNIPLERNWMKMVLLEDYSLERESPLVGGFLLSVEEKSELEQIKAYLSKPIKKRITNGQLRQALGIDIIPTSLVYEWGDIEGSDKFFSNASAIKNVADKVNNLSNKSSFLVYLENNLANDANLPIYPKGSGENKELTWFFTQKPKTVIQTIVNYSLENPAEKEKIKSEMEGKMDSNDNKKVLDRRVYGNGTEFTEAGIRKYLFEKEVGLTHSFSKNEPKKKELLPAKSF
ncbi:8579_t:CDS:2 [Entrophospora sp. SA101]|nr:8579_t:CDS:2 [Entrophospora sp. SA101]